MESSQLLVYYVMADLPIGEADVSPPFGTVEEARAYQAEYGGTVWQFPVPTGAGTVVTQ
jgi:hypothetical protein